MKRRLNYYNLIMKISILLIMAFAFTGGVCKADTSEFQNADSSNFSNRRYTSAANRPNSTPGQVFIDTINGINDATQFYGMRISAGYLEVYGHYTQIYYIQSISAYINGVDFCGTEGSCSVGGGTFHIYVSTISPCQKMTFVVEIDTSFDEEYVSQPIELYSVYADNADANDCVPEPDESSQSCSGQGAGNPIDVVTGKMWYTHTDISMKGAVPLSFSRHYSNKSTYNFDMGYGWRNNFDLNLDLSTGTQIRFYDERDHKITYTSVADRDWTYHTKLSQPNGIYQIDTFDGTKYQFNDISGTTAYLTKIVEANGDIYTITRDGSHRIANVTNAVGWELDFTYTDTTGDNKIYKITTNPGGASIYFDYDANYNLKSYQDAEAKTWTYLYEDPYDVHNLTKVIDPSGHTIEQHTYNSSDKVATSSIAGGNELLTFTYYSGSTTADNSKTPAVRTTYYWDPSLKVITGITGPGCACSGGESKYYAWSNTLLKKSETDGRGIVTQYDWYYVSDNGQLKPSGDLQQITEDSGGSAPRITTYSNYPDLGGNWDNVNRGLWETKQESSVDYSGHYITTTRNFDSYRELITTTVTGYVNHTSESHAETWQYGPHSELIRYTNPRSYQTNYVYYLDTAATLENRGQVYTVTNAKGHVTTYENYHFTGSAQKVTDPNSVVEESTYNNRGQILSRTLHAESDQVTYYNYWDDGLLKYVTHPEGNITEYTYTPQHRISGQQEELNLSTLPVQRVYYEYDTEDIKTMERYDEWITGSGWSPTKETDYTNDDYNRISHISYPTAPAQYTELRYDANGNLQYYNDGNHLLSSTGTYVTYTYDNFNRKTQEQIMNGGVAENTLYQYDTQDNITQITDPKGYVTTSAYDDFKRLISTTSPDTGTSSFTYDYAGNRTSETDALGITTYRTYDELDRVLTITYPTTTYNISYGYDDINRQYGIGRLTGATECPGCFVPRTTNFDYFKTGLLKDEIINQSMTTAYQYNQNGNMTSMTYPSGRLVTYTIDPVIGKPTAIGATVNGSSTSILSNITYYPFGPVRSGLFGDWVVLTRNHDLRYRMTYNWGGRLANETISYDYENNITNITGASNKSYSYDDAYRLLGADLGYCSTAGTTEAYTYDHNGNRSSKTKCGNLTDYRYGTNPDNNLLMETSGYEPNSFTYNNRGDIIADSYYAYSYGDHKRFMAIADTNANTVASYVYDYRLRRIQRSGAQAGRTYYYSQNDNMINETISQFFVHSDDYIYLGIEPIARVDSIAGIDSLYFYHNDHLMTPLTMRSQGGSFVWQGKYYPFGDLYSETGSVTNDLRFPGQYDERLTSNTLYYNYNRFFAPITGRYYQPDPLGLLKGTNLYDYGFNDPIIMLDPNGEGWGAVVIAIAGIWFISYEIKKHEDKMVKIWECEDSAIQCNRYNSCKIDRWWTIIQWPEGNGPTGPGSPPISPGYDITATNMNNCIWKDPDCKYLITECPKELWDYGSPTHPSRL